MNLQTPLNLTNQAKKPPKRGFPPPQPASRLPPSAPSGGRDLEQSRLDDIPPTTNDPGSQKLVTQAPSSSRHHPSHHPRPPFKSVSVSGCRLATLTSAEQTLGTQREGSHLGSRDVKRKKKTEPPFGVAYSSRPKCTKSKKKNVTSHLTITSHHCIPCRRQ